MGEIVATTLDSASWVHVATLDVERVHGIDDEISICAESCVRANFEFAELLILGFTGFSHALGYLLQVILRNFLHINLKFSHGLSIMRSLLIDHEFLRNHKILGGTSISAVRTKRGSAWTPLGSICSTGDWLSFAREGDAEGEFSLH